MKLKKSIANFLIIVLSQIYFIPLQAAIAIQKDMTLYEFLKTTDSNKVMASYKYPSLKLSANAPGKSTLSAHTPIVVKSIETISTKTITSGQSVNFVTVGDVKDEKGNILITSGTPVSATVNFAKSKDLIGKSGELTINDFHTTAVDGTYIPLSGSISNSPDDKTTLSVVLSVIVCFLFLLMKGEDAQLVEGTTKTVYTISETYIKTNNI